MLLVVLMPVLLLSAFVLLSGNDLRVTCRVPRDAENRAVTWGLADYSLSTRQLDGADARVTWETTFHHVPCDPGLAICEVEKASGQVEHVEREIIVGGCN